ncbi:PfkB family carbohydrate kinase [Kribbella sp. NBC_00662]|uniref:PfkB family carbohydrate kinase n=1 Tax=Kribbella sp. NBC_00662 TaxID=2975969 RepID=UPI00324C2576
MLLIIGNAAHTDLIARADRRPAPHEVGRLEGGPLADGGWLPGGSAPTVALVASEAGEAVRLWHPLPRTDGRVTGISQLHRAGIDLSACPEVGTVNRCFLVESPDGRLCWSSPASEVDPPDSETILKDVDLVIVCPQWGPWVEPTLEAAIESGVPVALVGAVPPAATRFPWTYAIVDRRQYEDRSLSAQLIVLTDGARGAELIDNTTGETVSVAATPVTPVDTTGAGDTWAGTFLAAIQQGATQVDAAERASARAAQACLVWGARSTPPATAPALDLKDRAHGVLLGVACGDAFGMPNSFLEHPTWRTAMEPGPANSPYHAGYPAGRITDDTEQSLALTDSLRKSGRHLDAGIAAQDLLSWFERVGGESSLAVGPSTKRAMTGLLAGQPLDSVGATGVTNGAPMRIAPIGIWAAFASIDETALIDEVAAACLPTHNTSVAISGAAAVALGVYAGMHGATWNEAVDAACRAADVGARKGHWVYAPSIGERIRWACEVVLDATDDQHAARIISRLVGAGEPVSESVPAAFAAATYADADPELAITIAGNLTGDTDTVAAMAGALCGAQRGAGAFPRDWIDLVTSVNDLDFDVWVQDLAGAAE